MLERFRFACGGPMAFMLWLSLMSRYHLDEGVRHPGYRNRVGMASSDTHEEDPTRLGSDIWIVRCLVL